MTTAETTAASIAAVRAADEALEAAVWDIKSHLVLGDRRTTAWLENLDRHATALAEIEDIQRRLERVIARLTVED